MSDVPIYTLGYGNRTIQEFIQRLKKYNISYLIDVRSSPYSRFKPEFSKEALEKHLKQFRVRYVFMGDTLGGSRMIVPVMWMVSIVPNIRELLMQRVQPWQGGKHQLFDGLLLFSSSGKGYVARWKGIPSMSTGYWIPDKPLTKVRVENKLNYCYGHTTYDEFNIA